MTRRLKETAETLSDYLKEAGGSLFSLRNSFAPREGKQMSEAEKALFADLYRRTRHALFGNRPAETVDGTKDFP